MSSEKETGGDVQSEAMPVQGSNYVALLQQFHNADTDNDGKLYKDVSYARKCLSEFLH